MTKRPSHLFLPPRRCSARTREQGLDTRHADPGPAPARGARQERKPRNLLRPATPGFFLCVSSLLNKFWGGSTTKRSSIVNCKNSRIDALCAHRGGPALSTTPYPGTPGASTAHVVNPSVNELMNPINHNYGAVVNNPLLRCTSTSTSEY